MNLIDFFSRHVYRKTPPSLNSFREDKPIDTNKDFCIAIMLRTELFFSPSMFFKRLSLSSLKSMDLYIKKIKF